MTLPWQTKSLSDALAQIEQQDAEIDRLKAELAAAREKLTNGRLAMVDEPGPPKSLNLKEATDAVERFVITAAVERAKGNMAKASRLLGIGRPNLYAKMRALGLK